MYQSRLHATNGIVSLAIDATSGELLEFVRESTADNVLKNHIRKTWSLLDGILLTDEGEIRFHPPRYGDIRKDASLKPKVEVVREESETGFDIRFPFLLTEAGKIPLSACINIRLLPEDCRTYWKLTMDNQTGFELDDIAFPTVDGIWIGESWQDDTLVYPQFAGCRVDNPTEQLAA